MNLVLLVLYIQVNRIISNNIYGKYCLSIKFYIILNNEFFKYFYHDKMRIQIKNYSYKLLHDFLGIFWFGG
jgi:hypothetical protein